MQKYATLCIIQSNKNKDLGISIVVGVRVVDSSNLFAPTNKIKDLGLSGFKSFLFLSRICSKSLSEIGNKEQSNHPQIRLTG